MWLCSHLAALHRSVLPLLYSIYTRNCKAPHARLRTSAGRRVLPQWSDFKMFLCIIWRFLLNCLITSGRRPQYSFSSSSILLFLIVHVNNGWFCLLWVQWFVCSSFLIFFLLQVVCCQHFLLLQAVHLVIFWSTNAPLFSARTHWKNTHRFIIRGIMENIRPLIGSNESSVVQRNGVVVTFTVTK